jgi:hypothetical protein
MASQFELDTPKRDGSVVINFLTKVVRFDTTLKTKARSQLGRARVHYGFVTGWGLGGVRVMLKAPPYVGHNEQLVITELRCRTNKFNGGVSEFIFLFVWVTVKVEFPVKVTK